MYGWILYNLFVGLQEGLLLRAWIVQSTMFFNYANVSLDFQRRFRGVTFFRSKLSGPALHDNKRITLSVDQAQAKCCDRLSTLPYIDASNAPLNVAAYRHHLHSFGCTELLI